ncbi:MAG: hypothetical protein V4733_08890 [Verrucomicrobiota bacterium]
MFKQKTRQGIVEYELEEEALLLRQQTGSERLQTRFRYENLSMDVDHRSSSNPRLIYAAVFLD